MSLPKLPPLTTTGKSYPSIETCDLSTVSHRSIAADLDGTLLIGSFAFLYYVLVAIKAGSLFRGLILLLSFPIIATSYMFVSEPLAIQMLIFISFAGLKVREIELAASAVLTRFYAAGVRRESYEVFVKCERRVVVTANARIVVETFVREYLGGEKVIGTEIEVNPKTKKATGFVKRPGVLLGELKKTAILKEFGDESPDIGLGDRESDHDFMSLCKVAYMVTKDDCPVIFHDNFILSEENGAIFEKRVTELTLPEFLAYGPQREPEKAGKSLLRKTKDGKIVSWDVETDDSSCTLQEAFQKVDPHLGFNIELKFDDHVVYKQDDLIHALQSILQVVFEHAKDRPIIFSSFQPDAALLVKKLQSTYPVFFLTNGGTELYYDVRRNSLEEALKLCLEGGLEGIVSEVKGIFRNPAAVSKIKESNLSLLSYGKLNNVPEAVYMQHLMGVEGVIVDLVEEITELVSDMIKPSGEAEEEIKAKPQFSQRELSFLLKLIPELLQL